MIAVFINPNLVVKNVSTQKINKIAFYNIGGIMKEIQSITLEVLKKYEVEEINSDYFIKAIEILKEEYPIEKYHYTRFFQKLGDKVFMHIRITFKNT